MAERDLAIDLDQEVLKMAYLKQEESLEVEAMRPTRPPRGMASQAMCTILIPPFRDPVVRAEGSAAAIRRQRDALARFIADELCLDAPAGMECGPDPEAMAAVAEEMCSRAEQLEGEVERACLSRDSARGDVALLIDAVEQAVDMLIDGASRRAAIASLRAALARVRRNGVRSGNR